AAARKLLYLATQRITREWTAPIRDWAYEAVGHNQPLAQRSYAADTCFRLLATVDAHIGQVIYTQRSHITTACLSDFLAQVHAAYPQAEQISASSLRLRLFAPLR
ncbi:MAG: hypothetical protein KIT52_20840, partial [Anaerolineae bacterium]|nr:hypothetical protein [Anaerolineae bacterium]